jgi:hypothetical protein
MAINGPYISSSQVAKSVPFDNAGTVLISADVESAILEVKNNPLSSLVTEVSTNTTTSTTSTIYSALNSMSIVPTYNGANVGGIFQVIFTGVVKETSAGSGVTASIFANDVQIVNSERTQGGGSQAYSSPGYIITLCQQVTITAGRAISIQWKSTLITNTVTMTGRTLTIIKVG